MTASGGISIGGGIGLKGQLQVGGALYWDLFIGAPIAKPRYLPTGGTTFGFSLNYSFQMLGPNTDGIIKLR